MLADIIHKIAEQEQAAKGQTGFGPYRPRPSSSGPEKCIRQMVYHAQGMPPAPLPGRSLLTFDDSSWHEELTLNWLSKHGILAPHSRQAAVTLPGVLDWLPHNPRMCSVSGCYEPIFEDDLHGHIDFEVTDLLQEIWTVDHKAVNHHSFARYWEGEILPLDYLTQLSIYMKGRGRTKGLLLIKNKNTAQYMEFQLAYDPESDALTVFKAVRSHLDLTEVNEYDLSFGLARAVQGAIEKFRAVNDYLNRKVLPARPYTYGTTFPCGYCAWEASCWLGYEQEIKEMGPGTILDQALYDKCLKESQLQQQQSALEAQVRELAAERKDLKIGIRNDLMEREMNSATVAVVTQEDAPPLPAFNIDIKIIHKKASEASQYEQTTVKPVGLGKKTDSRKLQEVKS